MADCAIGDNYEVESNTKFDTIVTLTVLNITVTQELTTADDTMGEKRRVRQIWIKIKAPWAENQTYDEKGILSLDGPINEARWIQATRDGHVLVAPLTKEAANILKIKEAKLKTTKRRRHP